MGGGEFIFKCHFLAVKLTSEQLVTDLWASEWRNGGDVDYDDERSDPPSSHPPTFLVSIQSVALVDFSLSYRDVQVLKRTGISRRTQRRGTREASPLAGRAMTEKR